MSLKLHYNILSTYSQKALLALYEKGVNFTPVIINLMDEQARAEYKKIYPLGKIPLLMGDDLFVPESTSIIEFLETQFPNQGTKLIPSDPIAARKVRFKDRMNDLYVNEQIAIIFFDGRKPVEKRNPEAVAKAQQILNLTFGYMEGELANNPTAGQGDNFTMADCAAFAPLFYAQFVHPYSHLPNLTAYFNRLMTRPSVQRLMVELQPALQFLQN